MADAETMGVMSVLGLEAAERGRTSAVPAFSQGHQGDTGSKKADNNRPTEEIP
jgi:hypothetical protein